MGELAQALQYIEEELKYAAKKEETKVLVWRGS
jgi:hypothetical protein